MKSESYCSRFRGTEISSIYNVKFHCLNVQFVISGSGMMLNVPAHGPEYLNDVWVGSVISQKFYRGTSVETVCALSY